MTRSDIDKDILIQFLTLRKLCSFVRSNRRRKPIASLKKAVVKLRNLKLFTQNSKVIIIIIMRYRINYRKVKFKNNRTLDQA